MSQANSSSGVSVEVVSVGWADFEEDLQNGEGGSDCKVSDSTESSGPRMGMPHREHSLYADLLQRYDNNDGEVLGPSTEVQRYSGEVHDTEEGSAGVRVLIWPILLQNQFLGDSKQYLMGAWFIV